MGEVILGLPGPWAEDNFEAADLYTTKIGGLPDWPNIKSAIRPDLLCHSCGESLCLVAQIYAPISSKCLTTEERVIYIFGCVAPNCDVVTWRALRVQKSFHDKESKSSGQDSSASSLTTELQNDLWTFDSDEENDDEINLEELGKALTEATALASQSKKQNTSLKHEVTGKCSPMNLKNRVVDEKTPVLPCFYIYTQEEEYSKNAASVSSKNTSQFVKEKQSDDTEQAPDETWEGETYEYDRALNADRTYLKFKKRMDAHPEQCFRYFYGGKPLLAMEETEDPGRCMLCGELRHYEMQLMPPLLYFLQEATTNHSFENWNWMSLIVYTCSKSCAPCLDQESDGWVVAEEAVVVQTE